MVLAFAAGLGAWTQHDSLSKQTGPNPNWNRVTHIEEQYLSAKRTGDKLADDLAAAVHSGASFALIYGEDIADPANQGVLAHFAGR
jgi:hypothetical protein